MIVLIFQALIALIARYIFGWNREIEPARQEFVVETDSDVDDYSTENEIDTDDEIHNVRDCVIELMKERTEQINRLTAEPAESSNSSSANTDDNPFPLLELNASVIRRIIEKSCLSRQDVKSYSLSNRSIVDIMINNQHTLPNFGGQFNLEVTLKDDNVVILVYGNGFKLIGKEPYKTEFPVKKMAVLLFTGIFGLYPESVSISMDKEDPQFLEPLSRILRHMQWIEITEEFPAECIEKVVEMPRRLKKFWCRQVLSLDTLRNYLIRQPEIFGLFLAMKGKNADDLILMLGMLGRQFGNIILDDGRITGMGMLAFLQTVRAHFDQPVILRVESFVCSKADLSKILLGGFQVRLENFFTIEINPNSQLLLITRVRPNPADYY